MVQPSGSQPDREVITGTWQGAQTEFLARRVIVKLKPGAGDADGAAAARDIAQDLPDGHLLRAPGQTGRVVYEIAADAEVASVAESLADRDDVEYAEPDVIDHAALVPNDARLSEQWSLAKVRAFDAWDLETGDSGVVVGIIDSGISMSGPNLDHPDLTGAHITLGTDFVDGGTPRDTNGHGTHVAGIAVGTGNNAAGIAGMAWGTRVYICRTLDTSGNGSSADFADAVEEITDFAVTHGIKAVINYSGGGGPNQTKLDACNYASSRGMLLCAAAGNDDGGPVIWPAAYSTTVAGVVCVGSTDADDTVSSFSNHGPEITVVAPGGDILSAMPTYSVTIPGGPNFARLDGTSMATPLVSGLAALMWSRHPSFTNQKIKDCLTSTAVKLGSGSFDNTWGHGRVDALAAVKCGDLVIPPSRITCPPKSRITCPSRITVKCPSRVKAACPKPSRLPLLCPTSRISFTCPSRLPVLCPTSRIAITCAGPSRIKATCPVASRIETGCRLPSRISCGPGGDPFGPVINPGRRPGGFGDEEESWYGGEGADFVGFDEAGQEHHLSLDADDAAASEADYYWIDEDGTTRYWSGGGGA